MKITFPTAELLGVITILAALFIAIYTVQYLPVIEDNKATKTPSDCQCHKTLLPENNANNIEEYIYE